MIISIRLLAFIALCSVACDGYGAWLGSGKPFSVMAALSENGWHDLTDEALNLYGQGTYISNWKSAFPALYTNLNGTPNSLSPEWERSYTGTVTFYAGLRGWKGAEFYVAPELIAERPLSGLKGLGGSIQNFELQKNGAESATWYRSRAYFKQTFSLGGNPQALVSGPLQLGGTADSRRLVLTFGRLSVLDVFDKNAYSSDLRNQFFNMAFLTHAAYDFAADARGYSWGLVGEYFHDNWAIRLGRFLSPKNPNGLPLEEKPLRYYGDQAELEHHHVLFGQPGAIRLLAYRNAENMGSWNDAIAAYRADPSHNATTCEATSYSYGSGNAGAPDLCWARKPRVKVGAGLNVEQAVTEHIGVFFRGMWSDGKTEVYSYTSSDRSMSLGTLLDGALWHRSGDQIGLGYAQSWLSRRHVDYLGMGGIDGFIGDGRIHYRPEIALDIYYKMQLIRSTWLTVDYQHIENPAYNADRGPLDIYGFRVHLEF